MIKIDYSFFDLFLKYNTFNETMGEVFGGRGRKIVCLVE
jgi:hypothetical protein